MINKYKNANKDLKEFTAKKVKSGTAKNGSQYTVFTIADKINKPDGSSTYDYYSVFSWQENLNLCDGDKVVLEEITAIEVKEDVYNGKTSIKKTIFADVKITQRANPNNVKIVGGNNDSDPFNGDSSDSLPF